MKNTFLIFEFNIIAMLVLMITGASKMQMLGIILIIFINILAILVFRNKNKNNE